MIFRRFAAGCEISIPLLRHRHPPVTNSRDSALRQPDSGKAARGGCACERVRILRPARDVCGRQEVAAIGDAECGLRDRRSHFQRRLMTLLFSASVRDMRYAMQLRRRAGESCYVCVCVRACTQHAYGGKCWHV